MLYVFKIKQRSIFLRATKTIPNYFHGKNGSFRMRILLLMRMHMFQMNRETEAFWILINNQFIIALQPSVHTRITKISSIKRKALLHQKKNCLLGQMYILLPPVEGIVLHNLFKKNIAFV